MRILIIEDNPADVRLVRELLAEARGDFEVMTAGTLGPGMELLASQPIDALLLDLGPPDGRGLARLAALQARFPGLPIVVLTPAGDEALDIQAVQLGAEDCLPKAQLDARLLQRALRYAIERKRTEAALRDQEAHARALVEQAPAGICEIDLTDLHFVSLNEAMCRASGYSREELLSRGPRGLINEALLEPFLARVRQVLSAGQNGSAVEFQFKRKDGSTAQVAASITLSPGRPNTLLIIGRDISESKRLESELRESQTKYRALVETTGEFVWETDASGRYTYCSPQMRALWGYEPEQRLGTTPFDVMPPEDREEVLQFFQSMVQSPRPFKIESRAYNAEGNVIFLETSGVPFFDEKGELQGYRGTCRDTTDRRKAEEALRESEAQAQALIKYAPTAIFELDYRGTHFISVNDAVCIISGYSREEMLSMSPFDLLAEESKTVFADRIRRQLAGEKIPDTVEYKVRKKDGSLVYATLKVSFSPRPDVALVIAHDITERRMMEESLRVSEESYRALFESISDGFVVLEKVATAPGEPSDFEYVAGNRAYGEILRFSTPLGRTIRQVFPNVPGHVFEGYDRLIETGVPFGFESDQAIEGRVFENHAFLVPGGTGRRIGVLIRDVTERRKAETDLRRYAEQLEAANREMESFSYSVSHDLRAPLRTLDGFSEALLTEYADLLDDTARDYLKRLRRASQTMSDLIDGMLKLAQIGRTELRHELVNLSQIARSLLEEMQAAQPERRVELVVAPGIVVRGDRQLLGSLLRNLLENSWKFTRKREAARIEFGVTRRVGESAYFVKDNGVGFDMKYAGKLFEPFRRMHPAREYPGTGIGLATAERIVHRHGGRIWAQSETGKGATFYFVLGA